MDRLDAMAAFVAATDAGSLAAAARRLGYSPTAVTRAITALEERVGAQLMHRTTRALRLTSFGETYLGVCRQVLGDLERAERGAAAEHDTPRGLLTLTAPVQFGRLRVRPVLDAFLDANPAVQGRLLLLDRVVGLIDEGVDVAVRLAHLPDSSLIATQLGEVRRILCAAPAYLARHGAPATPAGLSDHACIVANAGEAWSFARAPDDRRGGLQAVAIRPRLAVNAVAAAIDSALEGHGVVHAMSYQVADHLAEGRLERLLIPYEPPPIPVHLVMPSRGAMTAKVRRFVDLAAPALRDGLARTSNLLQPGTKTP